MILADGLIKKRILITGANGLLGQRLVRFFIKRPRVQVLATSLNNKSVVPGVDYTSCDITNREKFKRLALDFYPDYIINAASFNDREKCESERENTWKVNVKAVEYITEIARVIDSHIIHLSTDQVFDGKRGPYSENTIPNPISYYARTKLASENVLKLGGVIYTLVRTNLLYGVNRNGKKDLFNNIVSLLESNKYCDMAIDEFNSPTYTDDLVQAISEIIEFKKSGIFHVGGKEQLSNYSFVQQIAAVFNFNTMLINPVLSRDIPRTARYPLKSGLVIIKSQTELGYKPHSISEALALIKKEYSL